MKLWGKEQRSECLGDGSPCWVCWNSWLGSLQTRPCLLKVVRIIIGWERIPLLCLQFKGKWLLSPARAPKIFSSLHSLGFWLVGCCCVSIPGAGLSVGSQRPKAFCAIAVLFDISKSRRWLWSGHAGLVKRPRMIGLHGYWTNWVPMIAYSLPTQDWLYLCFFFPPWGEINQFKVCILMMLSSFTVLCNWFMFYVPEHCRHTPKETVYPLKLSPLLVAMHSPR